MTFEVFIANFGNLLKQAREKRNLTLYELAYKSDIVADHIQKIESIKHGSIQVKTYAKLLSGLKVSLSFYDMSTKRLILLTDEEEEFIHNLFFGISEDVDLQFLNQKPTLLLLRIATEVHKHRKLLGLTQKELAKKAQLSNATIVRIEEGKHDFRLKTLYKLSQVLYLERKAF
jgi:transcriptional regulator with XRE-family HTH domain